jgi:DNA-binding NarL/FixJ family response regulator
VTDTLKVLLVDDIVEMRDVLRVYLSMSGGFAVVGEAADGHSAIDEARRTQPDAIVLDLGLPDMTSAEVISDLRAAAPGCRLVVLSGRGREALRAAAEAGADATVAKEAGFADATAQAIATLCRGGRRLTT